MMEDIKVRLQKLMDKQQKKSELYVQTVQKANKLKAESYSLYLEVSKCREQLMTHRQSLIKIYKNNNKLCKQQKGTLRK